jgi:predicted small integral membrane protein
VRRDDLFQNLNSLVIAGMSVGLAVIILLIILAVFVGKTSPRIGFLPWTTTWGDRFFMSILVLLYIGLLWLKFVEPFIPIHGALVLGIITGTIIVKYG